MDNTTIKWHHYIVVPSKTGDFKYITYVNETRRLVMMERGRYAIDYPIRYATEICERLHAKGSHAYIIKSAIEMKLYNK